MNNNVTRVSVGGYTIELTEEILKRLCTLKECDYMTHELDDMINKTIEMYDDGETGCINALSAKDAMGRISLLRDAKKDYEFLCSLNVGKESVFVEEDEDE